MTVSPTARCDGAMVADAALKNPFIFNRAGATPRLPSHSRLQQLTFVPLSDVLTVAAVAVDSASSVFTPPNDRPASHAMLCQRAYAGCGKAALAVSETFILLHPSPISRCFNGDGERASAM